MHQHQKHEGAVHEAAAFAAQQVRNGNGPYFLECQTYRFRAHSMFDPDLYRDAAEIEQWKQRGPLHTFSQRLKAEGKLTEDEFLLGQHATDGGGDFVSERLMLSYQRDERHRLVRRVNR